MRLKRFGSTACGKFYPRDLRGLSKESIIYCIGAGRDITHDIALLKELQSKIYIIDPTPKAIEYINSIKKNLRKSEAKDLIIIPYAVGTANSIQKFYKPINNNYISHSLLPDFHGNPEFREVTVKTIKSIMTELNHNTIDLLKIDVEGMECEVLEALIKNEILPKYISVDLDFGFRGETLNLFEDYCKDRKTLAIRNKCLRTIELLQKNKYSVLHNESAQYTFSRSAHHEA